MTREKHTIDAEGKILGRLATRVAILLQGKHKVSWAPHTDVGDAVTVVNAAKIKVTGRKLTQKVYHKHTGYVGHVRTSRLGTRIDEAPDKLLFEAIKHMLPVNRKRQHLLKRLTVLK